MLRRLSLYLAAVLLGVGLALTTSVVATAVTSSPSVEYSVDESGDRSLTSYEVEVARTVAGKHELVTRLVDRHGGKIDQWNLAMIEGEERGAYTIVSLEKPMTREAFGLRPDVEALKERHADQVPAGLESVRSHALDLDIVVDETYPLEALTLAVDKPISRYTVLIDIPTERVISVMPYHEPPAAPPTPEVSGEPRLLPVQPGNTYHADSNHGG